MGEVIRDTFQSVTGEQLEKRLWLPQGQPKAVVQLVHGMAEHIDRYEETAQALSGAGFVLVGHTHLGHGAKAATLGHFAKESGWDALIDDTHALRLQTAGAYPDLPYFLLGHSMGSFVVRGYCLGYAKGLSGILLSGTGHFAPGIVSMGLLIARLQCALGLGEKPGRLLDKISNAGRNSRYSPPRTAFDWLSSREEVVDAYIADPYCGFPFTVRGYRDLFLGLKRLYPVHLSTMEREIPIWLFSGDMDPVGDYGKGVEAVARELREAGVADVTVTLYPGGRHEMFNEKDRQAVWADVTTWIEAHGKA